VKGEREREREKNEKWKSCVASLVTFADPPNLKGLGWTKGKFCWIREFDVQVSILEKYGHVKCSHKFINCSIKKRRDVSATYAMAGLPRRVLQRTNPYTA
jgi:hypothetical protein